MNLPVKAVIFLLLTHLMASGARVDTRQMITQCFKQGPAQESHLSHGSKSLTLELRRHLDPPKQDPFFSNM